MDAPIAVSAFVLAGGESSRMGRDKALLVLPTGETLLARALRLAKTAAATVKVVTPNKDYSEIAGVPVVEDVYRGCGPLGGIHAALSASATDLNLVLGVDCPLVTPELLRFLVRIAAGTDKLATVPRVAGYFHNVCAVYRKEFATIAEKILAGSVAVSVPPAHVRNAADAGSGGGGKRRGTRVDCLFTETPIRVVEEDELRRAGFGAELFANVNTPIEFAALSRKLQR
jgi:molybdopterin-guanine dinucleotide biosynthesis protein A